MTTRKEILQYPNPALKLVAEPVTIFGEELVALAETLRVTASASRAEGLAATQVGDTRRVFVLHTATDEQGNLAYKAYINPEVLSASIDLISAKEGCLSFPGVYENIKRPESVKVKYQDETGAEFEETLTGLPAVAFQHELDHLNGICFTERMGKLQRDLALKKLAKVRRNNKHQNENMQRMVMNAMNGR